MPIRISNIQCILRLIIKHSCYFMRYTQWSSPYLLQFTISQSLSDISFLIFIFVWINFTKFIYSDLRNHFFILNINHIYECIWWIIEGRIAWILQRFLSLLICHFINTKNSLSFFNAHFLTEHRLFQHKWKQIFFRLWYRYNIVYKIT